MKNISNIYETKKRPEKVLCFGEGNFLRAFTAPVVQGMNDNAGYNGNIVMLQGVETGLSAAINAQKGLYTVIERGALNGQPSERFRVIDSVSRCIDPYSAYGEYLKLAENPDLELIVSNTTEFGICYDAKERAGQDCYRNFPAKLTDFLYRRFCCLSASGNGGLIILPCELIEHNGRKLKEIVFRYTGEWLLPPSFVDWMDRNILFADTLVDRIVSGFPKAEAGQLWERLGYQDNLLDVCEPFLLWVIETQDGRIGKIPFSGCGADVVIADDLASYRTRKVRILNGTHTMSALAGHLAGFETMEQLVKDADFNAYICKGLFEEIIPSFTGADLKKYAEEVIERFSNPYLYHKLLSIALNSISKFKTRVLPSILDYTREFGKAPAALCFSFAALYLFYTSAGESVNDEPEYLQVVASAGDITGFMKSYMLWGEDLSLMPGFRAAVLHSLDSMERKGIKGALRELLYG